MSLKKDIVWRIAIIYGMALFIGISIIGRILYLQLFEVAKYKETTEKLTYRNDRIKAGRGDILSHDGRPLATSVPFYEIRVDMLASGITESIIRENIDSLSTGLSKLFKNYSPQYYKRLLLNARKNNQRYLLLRRKASFDELKVLQSLPILRMGRNAGGLISLESNSRIMPHGNLASRTIGYLSRDERGPVVGIEGAFHEYLEGEDGVRLMKKVYNDWIPVDTKKDFNPKDGKDVVTTIDVNLQDVAESALLKQLKKHNAHHGTVVLMEVKTGKIRAIVNLQRLSDGSYKETYNYAVGESSEPGSTFKLPVLMTALEDGYVDLHDTIDTGNGTIQFFDTKISDAKKGGYGRITVQKAFEISSNVAMAKIITDHYQGNERRFIDRLYEMNLHEPLGVEIKGEGRPQIKYPTDRFWSGISLPMMSFGYEVTMTPLQILSFYNAVANDGKMMKPMLVERIEYHGKIQEVFSPQIINPAIASGNTIRKAKTLLEGVVSSGTASNLRNLNYPIAGKTGTAQIANEKYGYKIDQKVSYQASFCGYFPADNPKYSCIVVVNSPNNDVYYGNLVAGPVFKEIGDKVFATSPYLHREVENLEYLTDIPFSKSGYVHDLLNTLETLNIPYEKNDYNTEWVVTRSSEQNVICKGINYQPNLVPNVLGMGAKDAVYIMENAGLHVELIGRGTVVNQSVSPGENIKKNQRIILEMSII